MTVPPSKSDALPAESGSLSTANSIDTGPPPREPRICDSSDTGTHHWICHYQWTSIAGTLGLRDRLCSDAAVVNLAALSERTWYCAHGTDILTLTFYEQVSSSPAKLSPLGRQRIMALKEYSLQASAASGH